MIDPAWTHASPSKAHFYQRISALGYRTRKSWEFTGDIPTTAQWVRRIVEQFPDADLMIDAAGPGAALIQLLTEKA